MAVTQTCYGIFSNGTKVNVPAAVYMPDVGYIGTSTPLIPVDKQTACDVHTFAWNQFLYLTQNGTNGQPRFMAMAPWYNALTTGAKPGPYPGGPTDLRTSFLDQKQAGDDDHLVDVANQTVRYDIRFDVNMYDSIVMQNYYTAPLFSAACNPDPANNGNCKNNDKIWMSRSPAPTKHPEPGSIEVENRVARFRRARELSGGPVLRCQGRFGLVGFHYVNKTFSHGEWIWASFEHVGNDPDCKTGGDETIAQNSPLGTPWSFFNPTTAGSGVMSSKMCSITGASPQCNSNPNPSGDKKTWIPVERSAART